jgi:hypothetical protein
LQKLAWRKLSGKSKTPQYEFAAEIYCKVDRGPYDPATAKFADGDEADLPTLLVADVQNLNSQTEVAAAPNRAPPNRGDGVDRTGWEGITGSRGTI